MILEVSSSLKDSMNNPPVQEGIWPYGRDYRLVSGLEKRDVSQTLVDWGLESFQVWKSFSQVWKVLGLSPPSSCSSELGRWWGGDSSGFAVLWGLGMGIQAQRSLALWPSRTFLASFYISLVPFLSSQMLFALWQLLHTTPGRCSHCISHWWWAFIGQLQSI